MSERAPRKDEDATLRLDRWLWCVRLFKTRALAQAAVQGGHVHVNGRRPKPALALRVGDLVEMTGVAYRRALRVKGIPRRRGPATEAAQHYEETGDSLARRDAWLEQRSLERMSRPHTAGRPDKRQRRRLLRLLRG